MDVQTIRSYEVFLMEERGMNPRTVNLHLSVLSGFCRFLMKRGVMASNPVHLVKKPAVQKRLPEFFTSCILLKCIAYHIKYPTEFRIITVQVGAHADMLAALSGI